MEDGLQPDIEQADKYRPVNKTKCEEKSRRKRAIPRRFFTNFALAMSVLCLIANWERQKRYESLGGHGLYAVTTYHTLYIN